MAKRLDENEEDFIFQGFDKPNFTPVPDEFFDRLLGRLSGAEIKVLLYIFRRTFGFKKNSDDISFSQICDGITKRDGEVLDEGTGLSKSTAQIAIKGLLSKKVIVAIKRQSFERGNEPTTYALNFLSTPYTENRHRGMPKIGIALYRKSATQETVIQDTENNDNVEVLKIGVGSRKNENDDDNDSLEKGLLYQVIEYTGDRNPRSEGTFLRIIRKLGYGTFDRIMGITKDAVRSGDISQKKSASYFIGVAKKIAEERGIDLGFKYNGVREISSTIANLKANIGNTQSINRLKDRQLDK